jgi:putative chitinase
MLTIQAMYKLWPHGNDKVSGLLEGIVATAQAILEKYKVASALALALTMGQFSEECNAGLEMVENLNYSAPRLRQVWPSHFTTALAVRSAHNQQMIGNIAYGGRMGNAPLPSNDGFNYRGRGLSQLTGKENYQRLAKVTGIDVITHPEYLSDPRYAFECGVADFVELCGCLPFSERGDVINTTKHLNGGLNGLAERERWTVLWRKQLGV